MASSPSYTLENMENKFKNIIMQNGSSIILNTAYPLFDMVFQSLPMLSNELAGIKDMKIYENRVETFNSGWSLDFLTPSVMANAGFYYTGRRDLVKCPYCDKEFNDWKSEDDPLVDHKRNSPHCRFFEENKGFDVCGFYHDLPAGITEITNIIEETKMIQDIFKFSGIVKQLGTRKTLNMFGDFENRLKSFENCEVELNINSQKLCEAGFIYMGDGSNDRVECFCCNQGLEHWDPNDEPWTEHLKFSPTCSYVLLSKGKNFIKKPEVLKIDKEELPESVANDENTLEDNVDVSLVKWKPPSLDNEDIDNSSSGSDLCKKGVSGTIPDSMLCKICLKEEVETVFITCGHVVACIQCAVILDQCAICRQPSNMVFRVYISREGDNNEDVKSEESETPLNPMLCKVCDKEEMQAFVLPCKHIHACIACATKSDKCLVCSEPYLCIMQVYL